MNKLTIAFIVITIVVVLVIGTLLGIRYFSPNQNESDNQIKGLISAEQITEETSAESPETPIEEKEEEEPPVADYPAIVSPFDYPEPEEETATEPIYPKIDITKVVDAGFKIADLLSEKFNGTIFKNIDISEYNDDNHKQFIITESEEYAGTITELIFPNPEIALEVYDSIKTKIADIGEFTINETNQYGDNSFFANHNEEKNSVFLVVKIKDRLYTLYYPAKNHNKMKNLINLL